MRKRNPIIYAFILVVVAILQNTVLSPLQVQDVRPDFTLLLLVFFAHQLGPMEGKLMGFVVGMVMDVLGIAPLGFHSLIYTIIGHMYGTTRGKMYVDAITMPALFAFSATLISLLISLIITILFMPERVSSLISLSVLLQIGIHILMAPFVYGLLRLFKLCREHETQML